MLSADDRPKFSMFCKIYISTAIFGFSLEKEKTNKQTNKQANIQMSTNKPSIGSLVLEIASVILRKYCLKFSIFVS